MSLVKKYIWTGWVISILLFVIGGGVSSKKGLAIEQGWTGTIAESFNTGDGSTQNPYVISNAEELAKLANDVNQGNNYSDSYFVLSDDIDLNGQEWTPIGYWKSDNDYSYFKGKFDGKNHIIKNFYIYSRFNGIFGEIENAELKNINIVNEVDSEHKYNIKYGTTAYIGGLVGYVEANCRIEHCSFTGSINGEDSYNNGTVGGIVGYMEKKSSITDCTNYGNIIAEFGNVGGIVGESQGSVAKCVNKGSVTKCSYNVGGIAGVISGDGDNYVKNCVNMMDFSIKNETDTGISSRLGGIVGTVCSGSVQDCRNEGNIHTSKIITGGITGCITTDSKIKQISKVDNCKNTGTICAEFSTAGGICADIFYYSTGSDLDTAVSILNCCNRADVTSGVAGGIVGNNAAGKTSVINCFNTGDITSSKVINLYDTNTAGGIAGQVNCRIINCFNTGDIGTSEEKADIGGITGCFTKKYDRSESKICNSYNVGNVSGTGNVGTLVGYIKGIQYSYTATQIQNCFYKENNSHGTIGKVEYESVVDKTYMIQNITSMCRSMNLWVAMNQKSFDCCFWQIENETEVSYGYPFYWGGTTKSKIGFQFTQLSLEKGEKRQLVVSGSSETKDSNLIWGSSNDNIARVDEKGMVTAVAVGHAVIKCLSEDFAIASCEVTVTATKQSQSRENQVKKIKATSKVVVPRKPVIKYLRNKPQKKLVVSWKKIKGAKGYQLQYGTTKKYKKAKKITTRKIQYTMKKLKKNKTYYVRVRAYSISGGKKVYGKWSKMKKVKIKR